MSWQREGKKSPSDVGFGKDPTSVKCPNCGGTVWIAKGTSGSIKCPYCGKEFG